MKKPKPAYAQNLRRLRLAAGLTQAELARRLKVSSIWICELESGRRPPSFRLLVRAAKVLGVEVPELLTGILRGS
jgi:hypothetical protein